MDHSHAPILSALADYHRRGRYGFTPPGHRHGRGADRRTIGVIGQDAFASDVLAGPGLDDRLARGGFVADAENLMADASGALIVSPSPYGTCADIASIAQVCHERGKPLIADEAWGAHLPFHDELPTWAMDAGADVCVVSVHKMSMGFEQGSVFHLQRARVPADRGGGGDEHSRRRRSRIEDRPRGRPSGATFARSPIGYRAETNT